MFQLPESKSTKVIEVDTWSNHILSKLQDFYVAGNYCDFNVHCGEETFKIHKVIAYCSFEYIESNAKDNNSIRLPDIITPLAFKCIIKFMYTGKLHISAECREEVLKAAILLKVPFITRAVEEAIPQNDSQDNDLSLLGGYSHVDPSRRFPVTTKQRKTIETSDGNKISVLSVEQSHLTPSPWNYPFWRKTFPAVAASTSATTVTGFLQPARITLDEELLENIILEPLFEPLSYATEPLRGQKESIEELTKQSNDYLKSVDDVNNDRVYSPLYGGIFTSTDYSFILPIKRGTRYNSKRAYITNTSTAVEDYETESNDGDSVAGAVDDFEPEFERPPNKKRRVYGMNSPRKDKNGTEICKSVDDDLIGQNIENSTKTIEEEKEGSDNVAMNEDTSVAENKVEEKNVLAETTSSSNGKNLDTAEKDKGIENSKKLENMEKTTDDVKETEDKDKVDQNEGKEGDNVIEKKDVVTEVVKESKITLNPNIRVRKVIVNGNIKVPQGQETKLVQEVLRKYPELINGKGKFLYLTITSASLVGDTFQNLKIVASDDNTATAKSGNVLTITGETLVNGETNNKNTKKESIKNRVGGNVENIKGPWECFICGSNDQPLKLLSYYDYRQHLHVTHNEKKDTRYCEYCGYKTLKRNLQLYHLYTRHNVEPPPATVFPKCKSCNYIALSEKLLIKHGKVHERKIKTYICDCNTSFKDLITLNAHKINCRKETLPETIEVAEKEVEKSDTPTSNESTNQCMYCNDTFELMVDLNAHLRNHHRNEARKYKKLSKQKAITKDLGTITTTDQTPAPVVTKPNLNPSSELEAMNNVANSIAASIKIKDSSMDMEDNNISSNETTGDLDVPNSSENEYIVPEIINEGEDFIESSQNLKGAEEIKEKIDASEIANKFTNSKRNLHLIDSSGNRVEISPITSNDSKPECSTHNVPPDVVIFQIQGQDTPLTSHDSTTITKRRALHRKISEQTKLLNDWSSEEEESEDVIKI